MTAATSTSPRSKKACSYYGRIFARSGGLSDAVVEALKEQNNEDFKLNAIACDGIEACKAALLRASKNVLPNNFIEAKAEVAVDATGVSAADIQLPDGYKLSTDYGTEEEMLKVRPFGTIFIVTKL